MKAKELKDLSVKDLNERLFEEKAELNKLRFNHSVSGLENPVVLRQKRKDIARVMTEISARNNAAAAK